jgi:outer membrane protein TolC
LKIWVLAGILFSFPAIVGAAETVSLKEAVTRALEGNSLVKASGYKLTAAERGTAAAFSRYFPRIFFEEAWTASNAPPTVFMMKLDEGRFTSDDFLVNRLNNPSSANDFRTAAILEMPLFDLAIGNLRRAAQFEEMSKAAAHALQRESVALRVIEAYVGVHKARAHLDATRKAVAQAREQLRVTALRGDAGIGLKSDQLRARTFLSTMEEREIAAANQLLLARMRLAMVTGAVQGEVLDVSGMPSAEWRDGELSDFAALALANRQDVKELEALVAKGGEDVGAARNAYFPTVHGTARYQMNDHNTLGGRDNDSWTVGAVLRWELFDGLRRSNELDAARARQGATREYLEHYRKEVALEVADRFLKRDEAAKRLEVARNSVADSEEAYRLVEKRFSNSLAQLVELLDAQTALNDARATLVENEGNYVLATVGLQYAAGVLLEEVMQ